MKQSNVRNLKELELTESPAYNTNISGDSSVGRLGYSIDVSKNTVRLLTIPVNLTVTTNTYGVGLYTHYHNLGQKPWVIGTYILESGYTDFGTEYPIGLRGMIPERRRPSYGAGVSHSIIITQSDEEKVSLYLFLDEFVGVVKIKLLLLDMNFGENRKY